MWESLDKIVFTEVTSSIAMAFAVAAMAVAALNALTDKPFWRTLFFQRTREALRKKSETLSSSTTEYTDPIEATRLIEYLKREIERKDIVIQSLETERDAFAESMMLDRSRTPATAAKRVLMKSVAPDNVQMTPEAAVQLYQLVSDQEERIDERRALRETTATQLESASSMKSRMISLFVMFNIGLVIAFIYVPGFISIGKELILGLYVSLATFIVYVYRASNARALVLLAIKEDLKRYHDAEKYLASRRNAAPTGNDIDVLKLILINRSEREKHGEHPYELALKGITNSTILLKGGKVANVEKRSKGKESEAG